MHTLAIIIKVMSFFELLAILSDIVELLAILSDIAIYINLLYA